LAAFGGVIVRVRPVPVRPVTDTHAEETARDDAYIVVSANLALVFRFPENKRRLITENAKSHNPQSAARRRPKRGQKWPPRPGPRHRP
jgi:hypothetical protein